MQKHSETREQPWTIRKLLKWTDSYFKTRNIENPRASAEIILAHALNLKRIDLYIQYDQPLVDKELALFKSLIKRRVKKEPVAYIVGKKEFWSLNLEVTKDVLIPRPDTECLVEAVLKFLPDDSSDNISPGKGRKVLELGTGSGAISIALSSERPVNIYFASDRSQKALEVAEKNAGRHLEKGEIKFICGDWFEPFKENLLFFDIILSNPPYIKTGEIPELQEEVCKYEPFAALDGEKDGLGSIRHIIDKASSYLREKGMLFLEIGHDQKDEVMELAQSFGTYENLCCFKDYGGRNRVIQMQKKT